MWLWLKTKFALMMLAIGVDWPAMGDGDKLGVVVGTMVGLVGIALGVLGILLTKRQKEMAEEQHEFFREQRDNKPSLELWVTGMQQVRHETTRLTFSVRNSGKAAADGFAWEIVLPHETMGFAQFIGDNGRPAPVKITTEFIRQVRINFFRKDIYERTLFVGDMADVAQLVVTGAGFAPFVIQWRIYAEYGTVPTEGHQTITVAPRPEGLLNVEPVLTIPAVTPA